MNRDDKLPPLLHASWLTAAPSAECKLSVNVGDGQTDTHYCQTDKQRHGHRHRLMSRFHCEVRGV